MDRLGHSWKAGVGSSPRAPKCVRTVGEREDVQKDPHRRVIEAVGRTQAKTQGPITMRRKRILFATLVSLGDLYPILQGPHHVAQKLSSSTLPLKSESRKGAPFASLRLKSGAAFRSSAKLSSVGAWLGAEEQPTSSEVARRMLLSAESASVEA